MEANLTVSVDVETIPRLVGHLISEQELKIDPLTRLLGKTAHIADQGNILESLKLLHEIRTLLAAMDNRLEQCAAVFTSLQAGLNPQPKEVPPHMQPPTPDQVRDMQDATRARFSGFVSRMGEDSGEDKTDEQQDSEKG